MRTSVFAAGLIAIAPAFANAASASAYDVYENQGGSLTRVATIEAFDASNTMSTSAAAHYSYFSTSGHPQGINLGPTNSNFWVWDNTSAVGTWGFGFIFGEDNNSPSNSATLNLRIVDGGEVGIAVSDDLGEITERLTGEIYTANFAYSSNTDGAIVDNIDQGATIIIDSVDFGSITNWFAATASGTALAEDVALSLASEYRIVRAGVTPSMASVDHRYTYSFTNGMEEETGATGFGVPVVSNDGGTVVDGVWYGTGRDNLNLTFAASSYSFYVDFSTSSSLSGVFTDYALCHVLGLDNIKFRVDPSGNLIYVDGSTETDTGIDFEPGGARMWIDYDHLRAEKLKVRVSGNGWGGDFGYGDPEGDWNTSDGDGVGIGFLDDADEDDTLTDGGIGISEMGFDDASNTNLFGGTGECPICPLYYNPTIAEPIPSIFNGGLAVLTLLLIVTTGRALSRSG